MAKAEPIMHKRKTEIKISAEWLAEVKEWYFMLKYVPYNFYKKIKELLDQQPQTNGGA